MDYGKAFSFVKEDKDWLTKIIIGALMLLASSLFVPIFFLLGYQVAITRNVMDGDDTLPEWTDFGKLFKDGITVGGAQLIYVLPYLLLVGLLAAAIAIPAAASGNDEVAGMLAGGFGLVMGCTSFIFSIAYLFVGPAVLIQYARTGEFRDCFDFAEIKSIIKSQWVNILLVMLIMMVASFAMIIVLGISVITICGPFIIMIIGPVWGAYAQAHLYGQMARDYGSSNKADKFVPSIL